MESVKEKLINCKERVKINSPFLILDHEYIISQLIPTKSSKNSDCNRIFDEINKMHHKVISLEECIERKKIVFNKPFKASYYIQIKKNKVNFYFIYPKEYQNQFELILHSIWRGLEVRTLNEFPINLSEFKKKQLVYKNKDILSINTSKKDKFLINSLVGMINVLEDNQEIGILYNFIPTSQKESDYFINDIYKKEIVKYKNGENVSNKKSASEIIDEATKQCISFLEETVNVVFGQPDKKCEAFISIEKKPSSSTRKKSTSNLCKTQIICFVKSFNKEDDRNLFSEISKSFDIVSEDNKFIQKKINDNNSQLNIFNPIISYVNTNRTCIKECNNIFKMPNRALIKQYVDEIDHNDNVEFTIPKCLLSGTRLVGLTKINGKEVPVFYSSDDQIQRAEIVVIGPKGAGKTYLCTNMALNSIEAKRGVIIIEIIEDCPMCKRILKEVDNKYIINVDCRKQECIPALCYNEIEMNDEMEPYELIDKAIQRGQQLQCFLDSINDEDSNLKPRMIKYFFAACAVTYCVDFNASFFDIIQVLSNPEIRRNYIDSLSSELRYLLKTRINILSELDKEKKDGTIENDNYKIEGILNREALFTSVSYQAELISQKRAENNIDFKEALQDNKIILIQLPENVFTNPSIKNTMATFFLSKIWNAKKQLSTNENKQPTELYFDEFYKCPNATKIFEDIFVEGRKFNLTSVVTIHTLDELSNKCQSRLISGGASYLLLYGTNAKDFKYLTPYIDNLLEYEDLEDLPRFHGICLIKNEDKNYSTFISRFPENFLQSIKNYKE